MGKQTATPKQEIFCGNPMCEYHRVPTARFLDPNTIKITRRGHNELLSRMAYRLVSDDGLAIFEKNLCDICGNVIEMINPEKQ